MLQLLSFLISVSVIFSGCLASSASIPVVLSVRSDGIVLKNGIPFRGIGVNYVNGFMANLANPSSTDVDLAFQTMKNHSVPFTRIVGSGWGASGMALYFSNKTEYFRRMDLTIATAEKYEIGLVFSLFWPGWVQGQNGERGFDPWYTPANQTYQNMSTYVQEVVTRYLYSPAIWVWQWGNELNLVCDLPNAASLGILPSDNQTHENSRRIFKTFANFVRQYDPVRLIDSGNAMPRPSAWHQIHNLSWTTDTVDQMIEVARDDAAAPLGLMHVHCYGSDFNATRLPALAKAAWNDSRPLFVGEFGVSGAYGNQTEPEFMTQLDILVNKTKVQLAALWEFDLKPGPREEWRCGPDNDRWYMFLEVEKVNLMYQAQYDELAAAITVSTAPTKSPTAKIAVHTDYPKLIVAFSLLFATSTLL
jgi:hypothetical protein